ncbi:MAG: glycosyl transferase family 28 [Chromatiales bacterium]|nr:glycosyl transferase family 28 [Chromatiales bacterium]
MSEHPAPRVLFHVQHLLGTGHLRRVAAIARECAEAGATVWVASGGRPVADLELGAARLEQLPPLRSADATYRILLDAEERPIDDAWRARRRAALLALLERAAPDVVVVETWPFGRRMLRFEIEPLLDRLRAMNPRAAIACSVRDIVEPRDDPARSAAMARAALATLDRVLVHADPRVVTFDLGFPDAARLGALLAYTGFVTDASRARPPAADVCDGTGEVLVSAGGGAVGERLLVTAARAAGTASGLALRWRLLAAPGVLPAVRARLGSLPGNVILEPNRADFPALLARSAVSVSQAGYNTVVEVLAAGARAVLVPFAAHGEREQGLRARALAAAGRATVVEEAGLDPTTLAVVVARAVASPAPQMPCDLDGARRAAALVVDLARAGGGG